MESNRLVENPVNKAERARSRSHASIESEEAGPIEPPCDSIVSLFERVTAANPHKIASVCGNVSLTYGVLNSRANYIARHLRELGVRADSFVAIYLDRTPDTLIAMLGILKAGGAYLPIDSMYPAP